MTELLISADRLLFYCSEVTKASTGCVCGWEVEENKCVQQVGTEIFYYDSSKLDPVVTLYVPLTLNIPSLARQRCLSSWGPRRTPWFFFVISQLFDAVDYSNYVFWVSETIIQ